MFSYHRIMLGRPIKIRKEQSLKLHFSVLKYKTETRVQGLKIAFTYYYYYLRHDNNTIFKLKFTKLAFQCEKPLSDQIIVLPETF